MNAKDEALELFAQWFKESGDPWITGERPTDSHCFFCRSPKPVHHESCIYVKAKLLMEIRYAANELRRHFSKPQPMVPTLFNAVTGEVID